MRLLNTLKQFWPELLILGGIFTFLLAILHIRLNKSGNENHNFEHASLTAGGKLWYALRYVLKLGGFAVLSLLLVVVAMMVFRVFYSLQRDFSAAPSQVEIPSGLPFQIEEVSFVSEDGVRIAGWYVPAQNDVTIVLLHGYSTNRTAMLWHAKELVAAGYGVLLYDERASGESGGDHRSYGWEDPRDVKGALRFLKDKTDQDRVGIAGCSMGAQIAIQSAVYYPEIGAVWADAPATIRAQDMPPQRDPLVQLILIGNYMTDWASAMELGMTPPKPLIEIIGEIPPRPIMLVGSGMKRPLFDTEGEFMKHYAGYTNGKAKVWVIPDAGHCHGPGVRPQEYSARMITFFDSAFGIAR